MYPGLLSRMLLLCAVFAAGIGAAAADVNSNTDDRSTSTPTAHWFYAGVDANFVSSKINSLGARIADIEVQSIVAGSPRFVVRLVKNSGAYAVPGWWWYYGLTFQQVGQYLNQNNARLIDLEPYDAGGGQIRFAAVMVSQTGATARGWYWLVGVQPAQITALINNGGSNRNRLIDLDTYVEGGVTKYTAVFVANTGADSKAWWWYYNQTAAQVSANLKNNNARLIDLERTPSGLFNVIMVRNTGGDAAAWWWYYGFNSIDDVLKYSNQLGARPVDLETYVESGQRKYAGVFIDNSNAATRRIRDVFAQSFLDGSGNPTRGVFEAYLKRVGSTVQVDLNSAYPTEVASSLKALHLLHSLRRVQAGADSLTSPFAYYWYPTTSPSNPSNKDACPTPVDEVAANRQTDYNLRKGLQQMMSISDNRTTRGVVLRYGFPAINATAQAAGMVGTTLAGNIGCAYYDPVTGKMGAPGNDTTAADLAGLYERVYQGTVLTGSARTEFLNLANPANGAGGLQTIVNEEAVKLGKLAIASQFGNLVRRWSKGGSYGTCLGSPNCQQKVAIRSAAGIIRLPAKVFGVTTYRDYVYGHLISDVPVPDWGSATETAYINTYGKAASELFREEIRSALSTW